MGDDLHTYFKITTPLNVTIRTTSSYWEYLTAIKHPVMMGKEDVVKATLAEPDEIRRSKVDPSVILYYKMLERHYWVVAKHEDGTGFLITAYPVDTLKEGEIIWKK